MTKELSSELTVCEFSGNDCVGELISSYRYVDQGACWYEINEDGKLDYHPNGFYERYRNYDGCGGGEYVNTNYNWCSLPEGEPFWDVTYTKTVKTVTGTGCFEGSSTSGSGTETLRDEYTTEELVGVTVGQLPAFAGFGNPPTEAGQGSSSSSRRRLSADETTYDVQRAKYKWVFTPNPGGTTTLMWVERFDPDAEGEEPREVAKTYVYEGTGTGPVESPRPSQ